MKTPVIIISILAGGLVLAGLSWYFFWKSADSTPPAPPAPNQNALQTPPPTHSLNLIPVVSHPNQISMVELWWEPAGQPVPLSTVGLQLVLKNPQGTVKALSTNPSWSDDYKNTPLRIAFDDVMNNADGTVTLKFSLVATSPEPVNLTQKTKLLSVPLDINPSSQLTYTIDPAVSTGYDKQMNQIGFTLSEAMEAPPPAL